MLRVLLSFIKLLIEVIIMKVSLLIVLIALSPKIIRKVEWGLALFFAFQLFLATQSKFSLVDREDVFSVAGIQFYFNDFFQVFFLFRILIKYKKLKHKLYQLNTGRFLYYFIFYNFLIAFLYFSDVGFIRTISSLRTFSLPLFIVLYLLTFKLSKIEINKLFNIYTIYSLILIVIAFLSLNSLVSVASRFSEARPITAKMTLFVAVWSIINYFIYLESHKQKNLIYFIISIIFVIFMQHRSVWIFLAVGIIYLSILNIKDGNVNRLLKLGFIVIFLFIFILSAFGGILNEYSYFFNQSFITDRASFESSTGRFRIERWNAYFERKLDNDIIYGKGFAWDRGVMLRGRLVATHMHNHYIETLFNIGVAGLLLFFMFNYHLIKEQKYLRLNNNRFYRLINAILCSFAAYGVIYSLSETYYLFIGLVISFIIVNKSQLIEQ